MSRGFLIFVSMVGMLACTGQAVWAVPHRLTLWSARLFPLLNRPALGGEVIMSLNPVLGPTTYPRERRSL